MLTTLLLKLKTLGKNHQTPSQLKPWDNDSGVLNLNHDYYTMTMMSRGLFSHNPVWYKSSKFERCMNVE